MHERGDSPSRRIARWAWLTLALVCVGLGSIGTVVPLVPTTPFLLVAVFAASRSSPRLHRWLFAHPRFGPVLRHWRDHRALSHRAKRNAAVLIAASWLLSVTLMVSIWARVAVTLILVAVVVFLLTRPSPPAEAPRG